MDNVETARQADSDPGFSYSDLPDAANYIRLLRVLRAEDGQTVHCELSIWPTESAPGYNAISYTWGDPASNTGIVLSGKKITVRNNLEYVLRQAYWYDHSAYVWIDAVCINQRNKAEKSTQVAMMGDIYKNAERVLAGVGPHDDDSELLIRVIRKNKSFYTFASRSQEVRTLYLASEWSELPNRLKRPTLRWIVRHLPFHFESLAQAHYRFFRRSYFARAWVVQEVLMAKETVLCCGTDHLPFHLLHGQIWIMYLVQQTKVQGFRQFEKSNENRLPCPQHIQSLLAWLLVRRANLLPSAKYILRSLLTVASQETDKDLWTIERLLMELTELDCEDTRDKIYATLSLIDWQGLQRIYPDYDKPRFDLALEVLRKFVGRTMDVFGATKLVGTLHLHEEQYCPEKQATEHGELRRGSHQYDDQIVSQKAKLLSRQVPIAAAPIDGLTTLCQPLLSHGCKLVLVGNESQQHRGGLRCPGTDQPNWLTASPRISFLKSADMQEGDWIFKLFFTTKCMVVGREQADGRFAFMGYTECEEYYDHLPDEMSFNIWWDPEDLLMLAILCERVETLEQDGRSFDDPEVVELLSRRVCRYEGSSYATRTPPKGQT